MPGSSPAPRTAPSPGSLMEDGGADTAPKPPDARAAPAKPGRRSLGRAPSGVSDRFWALLGAEPLAGRDVLDVGTGAGRVALALAPYCRRVVGLDRDGAALEEARRRGAAAGLCHRPRGAVALRWPLVSLREVPRGGRADADARLPHRNGAPVVTRPGETFATAAVRRTGIIQDGLSSGPMTSRKVL